MNNETKKQEKVFRSFLNRMSRAKLPLLYYFTDEVPERTPSFETIVSYASMRDYILRLFSISATITTVIMIAWAISCVPYSEPYNNFILCFILLFCIITAGLSIPFKPYYFHSFATQIKRMAIMDTRIYKRIVKEQSLQYLHKLDHPRLADSEEYAILKFGTPLGALPTEILFGEYKELSEEYWCLVKRLHLNHPETLAQQEYTVSGRGVQIPYYYSEPLYETLVAWKPHYALLKTIGMEKVFDALREEVILLDKKRSRVLAGQLADIGLHKSAL